MDNMVRRANYVGEKFLINNIKKDRNNLLQNKGVLKGFGISTPIFDRVKKVYYDTPSMFFRSKGINISLNEYSTKNHSDLILRYDHSVKRIEFLKDMPETFIKKINKKDSVSKHHEYMAQAVIELVPKGLDVDALTMLKQTKVILAINKKRERYRIINNNGLKLMFSFEQNEYHSPRTKQTYKMNMLEIRLESGPQTVDLFNEFIRQLQLQEAMFIKQKHSDLFVGQEYVDL